MLCRYVKAGSSSFYFSVNRIGLKSVPLSRARSIDEDDERTKGPFNLFVNDVVLPRSAVATSVSLNWTRIYILYPSGFKHSCISS